MNIKDIDQVIEHVKTIADNVRCETCDKTSGLRYRYPCGHTTCDWCAINAEDCQICLSQTHSPEAPHRLDDVFTKRVINASTLLKECQTLFNTDVYQRRRISEQLKIEKELFPKCIQAPVKYENKRKSALYSKRNKENQNLVILPGEQISPFKENKMENSVRYVEQWLSKNHKDLARKPFRDLNVNTSLRNNKRILKDCNVLKTNYSFQKDVENHNAQNITLETSRKRSHTKIINKTSHIDNDKSTANSDVHLKRFKHCESYDILKKNDNDESGIFMDNDPIIIDDSQENYIDKDKEAWLAVLKANENETESTSFSHLDCNLPKPHISTNNPTTRTKEPQSNNNTNTRVPFYKRSSITEQCLYCNNEIDVVHKEKDVKITVDNNNFLTTIKIMRNVENNKLNPNTVYTQTDISDMRQKNDQNLKKEINVDCNNENVCMTMYGSDSQSEDLFADDVKNDEHNNTCLIIEESDSDTDIESSGLMPVKVDVHRSCNPLDYGVLSEVKNVQEHEARARRAPRGHTPTSTDSSDKENFNPNRMKKNTPNKKKHTKTDKTRLM